MPPIIKIFPDAESLNFAAAESFVRIGNAAIEKSGRFTVALAGGSTPKALYRLLSSEKFAGEIDWRKIFFFFGDERCVLPDDAESNFRMAKENLFAPLAKQMKLDGFSTESALIGEVYRWQTEVGDTDEIAALYEKQIRAVFDSSENNFPRFDLILLGMGDDGHTASLFPHTKALHETNKFAVSNFVEKFKTMRLTLTFPVINNAENVMFLVAGEKKAAILPQILSGAFQPERLPAQNVRPQNGKLFWLLDRAAAQSI